ncbi:MAG: DUF1858 domain-containing protein [Firmicutes bacterium]|nr:DUF1858 domain-containing protein [Bacillota bacterium]
MTIGEVLRLKPKLADVLAELGIGCGGCPAAQMETLRQGALMHGMQPERLLDTLKQADGA